MEESAFNKLTLGVYAIGAKAGDRENVMTAAWLTQTGSEPASLLVSLSQDHYTTELIDESGMFSVSVFSDEQFEEACTCGFISGREKDKLAMVPHFYGKKGLPLIEGTAAQFECEVVARHELGESVLFTGKVVSSTFDKDINPMTYNSHDFFD